MKRRTGSLIVVAALVSAIGLSACGSDSETASLYSEGLEIVQIMSEMVQSESYITLYTGNSSVQSIIQSLANGDYSSPKAVYAISIPEKSLEEMAEMAELDIPDNASEKFRGFVLQRMFGALMTRVNAMSGVENLAAASICTASKTFVDENVDGNVIYLYTYDNALPIAVTFMVGDNKSVSANGVFVMYDKLSLDSAEEIEALFAGFTVEVTKIQ